MIDEVFITFKVDSDKQNKIVKVNIVIKDCMKQHQQLSNLLIIKF